ncbi:hypothetical protein IAT38_001055 [Cryptococcus sp. DSM 104549]
MYSTATITALLASLALTNAIKVTSPDSDTVWKAGDSQTIEWEAVSTDATSFVVQLVNQAGYLADSPVTLIANQSTGDSDITNSATVSYPDGDWPEGTAFQINLVTSTKSSAAILAQSNQFNITSGGSSSSSSSAESSSSSSSSSSVVSSSTAPTTLAGSSTAVTVTSTGAAAAVTSATTTGASLPNSSSSNTSGAGITRPAGIAGVLVAAAAAIGIFA